MVVTFVLLYAALMFRDIGDIVHISAMGTSIIVLNSVKAVTDLLETRGAQYADRPKLVMAGELYDFIWTENFTIKLFLCSVGYKDTVFLCEYNARLRESRRLMSSYLTPRFIAEHLHGILESNTKERLLRELIRSPNAFVDHIRKYVE